MPRFAVPFGKRKPAAQDDVPEKQSFRVYERTEVEAGAPKTFDVHGISRQGRPVITQAARCHTQPDLVKGHGEEDNMFSGLSANRGSGSSNTTKTASTDTSSRHSAASTAPSSSAPSEAAQHRDETRPGGKRLFGDIPIPPVPKSNSGFLNRAGRTLSFGSTKKSLPPMPAESEIPPPLPTHDFVNSRPRGLTTSTASTATPPKINEQEFNLDLGGDFGKMFTGLDKRASVATVRDDSQRERGAPPRSLTNSRVNQPLPAHAENIPQAPYSPYSANSDHSNDGLLGAGSSSPLFGSPNERAPPVPRHGSPMLNRGNRPSDIIEDEDASLLKESLDASTMLSNSNSSPVTGRHRRQDDSPASGWRDLDRSTIATRLDSKDKEDNLFDASLASSARVVNRYVSRAPSPPRNRVMTPAQFERFRQEKERNSAVRDTGKATGSKDDDDDEDSYDDEEDEVEKSKQAAKQRRKQEAHMTVYRQQMMKVTGESANPGPRPNLATSMSTPNITSGAFPPGVADDGSDEDEEIPLAILAAHGFPNKTRPPTRLSSVGSNPNLRASLAPSPQPPKTGQDAAVSGPGGAGASRASHLPAFARNLPQDPFLGAGLVRNSMRESLALGGGAPAPYQPQHQPQAQPSQAPLPPGGLVGVIASEERSRAMRRGSPQMDSGRFTNHAGFESLGHGISPQSMYGMGGSPSMPQLPSMGGGFGPMGSMGMAQMPQMLTPGDQAQIHMTQQMQQFMQMQMQFMQMMTGNQGGAGSMGGASALGGRPAAHMPSHSMGDLSSRHSFVGEQPAGPGLGPPEADMRMRTMSMVQPSSSSWIQPTGGFAPSIRLQGDGYAPSIAPSERSNIGLPGRYRPVSHAPPAEAARRVSTMSGAITGWDDMSKLKAPAKSGNNSDDDDDESGWEAMKAKREKKKSIWRSKKGFGRELGALIS